MDRQILRQLILPIIDLSEDDLTLLTDCAIAKHLLKGEKLLRQGDICRSLYLVQNGYLRTYYNNDEAEVNMNFTFEENFTTNIKSFRNRAPSDLIIEAGEDSEILVFDLSKLSGNYPEGSKVPTFVRRLAIGLLLASEAHSDLLKLHSAIERYRFIEAQQPALLQRVSLTHIASYLNVARETLSRVRSRKE